MSAKSTGVMGFLRTGIMVSLVAALLWLMAEAQMVQSQTLSIQIVLSNPTQSEGGAVVRVGPDQIWDRTVELTLKGATSELDRAVRQLGGKVQLTIGTEIPSTPGIHELDLRAALRQHAVFQQSGVGIDKVLPESVSLEVDELVSVEVPIRIELPEGVEVQGSPIAEPSIVRLVGPSRIVQQMQSSGLEAFARIRPDVIGQLTPGRTESIRGVVIELQPAGTDRWETRVEPGRVDVRILLRSLTETLELPPMPVQIMVAPDEIGRYEIEIAPADRDVISVMVSGPGEGIERIRDKQVLPTAFLALSLDQLESRVTSAPIRVHGLPEGVRVVGSPRTVQLTIRLVESTDIPEGP